MKKRNQGINYFNFISLNFTTKKLIILTFFALLLIITLFSLSNALIFKNDRANLSQLKVTEEHPFYLDGNWVLAKELRVGDEFRTIDNKTARIKSIKLIEEDEPFYVYNLEVPIYTNFVVGPHGLIVHNSNLPKRDCLAGQCILDVQYPNGKVEKMSLLKFYEKFQNNPHLKILDSKGNPSKISSIVETTSLNEPRRIVKISYTDSSDIQHTIKLTSNHEIQLADKSFIPAGELRGNSLINTPEGPIKLDSITSYETTGVRVFEIQTKGAYTLTEKGPYLRTPYETSAGIISNAENWDSSRVYARIMSKEEHKDFLRTGVLKPREEGQLIPVIDFANQRELNRVSSMSSKELKDYHIRLGGDGRNDHVAFFRSDMPPETDGIRLRDFGGSVTEAKFSGGGVNVIDY